MSKIVAGTAFVLLGGATVTGGILLHKGSKSNQNTNEEKTTTDYDSELPASLSDFKSQGQSEGCVTSLFSTLEKTDGSGAQSVTADDLKSDYFGTDTSKTTEGCLVVNWNKDTYTNKWKGTFRFLWAVKGEDKGFLAFLLGTPSNDGSTKAIKWEGVAYTLENQTTSGNKKWTASKKHEISSTGDQAKSFKKESTDQNNKFPQSGDSLADVTDKTFWGWFSQTSDMDNICSSSECTTGTPTKTSMKGYWQWSGNYGETATDNKKKLSSWTQNISTWWPEIFGDKLKVHELAEKQLGTWTKLIYSANPPTSSAPAA